MADKNWSVLFKFPQALAPSAFQHATVKASNFGLAVNRAWQEIKGKKGIKGKRLKEAVITVRQEEAE